MTLAVILDLDLTVILGLAVILDLMVILGFIYDHPWPRGHLAAFALALHRYFVALFFPGGGTPCLDNQLASLV
jgi:hypothetical protein